MIALQRASRQGVRNPHGARLVRRFDIVKPPMLG